MICRPMSLYGSGKAAVLAACLLPGCALTHSAPISARPLPTPPGPHVVHQGRLLIVIGEDTRQTQCSKNDRYQPVCFEDVRHALGDFMREGFWPSFREARVGRAEDKTSDDYVLEVSVALEALPPDADGPGWSAGAKASYQLTHKGETLLSEALASRSRADFPYGAPLAQGATDTLAAIAYHIGTRVCQAPEAQPEVRPELPRVATQSAR
jgi:hypothetical protein